MMHVKASDGPQGPRLMITSADRRISELSEVLSSLGVAHQIDHQTDWRACLTVPVADTRKAQEARQK